MGSKPFFYRLYIQTDGTITSVQRLPLHVADGKLLWVKCEVNIPSVSPVRVSPVRSEKCKALLMPDGLS